MKVLLVKTSSMGDVVHTLTALREAKKNRNDLVIDWLIEEDFVDIAYLAKQQGDIRHVIPIRFRQWRKRKPLGVFFNPNIQALKKILIANNYDLVLDAQSLIKSAFLAWLAKTPISGFDKQSAREKMASYSYQNSYSVAKEQHAIKRLNELFSQTLDYNISDSNQQRSPQEQKNKNVLLFHGTTWDNKRYPNAQWHELTKQLSSLGYHILIPRQGEKEYRTACAISNGIANVKILPEQSINEIHRTLASTCAVISVDTGLAHLAVYLGVPTVMLFGPTRPELTGGLGKHAINLVGKADDTACMKREQYQQQEFSASMSEISVAKILSALHKLI